MASDDADLQYYNEKLREMSEIRGFWSKYGAYLLLLTLRFVQKVT